MSRELPDIEVNKDGSVTITAKKGDTFPAWEIQIMEGDTDETLQPRDLTGCTAKLQVRKGENLSKRFLDLSLGNGLTLTNAEEGIITLGPISDVLMNKIPEDKYVFDMELTLANGEVLSSEFYGKWIMTDDTSA